MTKAAVAKRKVRADAQSVGLVADTRAEPSDSERVAISEARDRRLQRPPRAEMRIDFRDGEDGPAAVFSAVHSDDVGATEMVMDALGTRSSMFTDQQLALMISGMNGGNSTAHPLQMGAALAFLGAIAPKDEVEAALGVQMYATHEAAMSMLGKAVRTKDVRAMAEYGNLATKLQRTFTAQIDALGKHRRGGEQVVRHLHQYIDNRGGQAVIGENVHVGGRGVGGAEIETQPFGPNAGCPSMPGEDQTRHALPMPGETWPEALSDSRGCQRERSTSGQPERDQARKPHTKSKG